jgi:hypothetical protein
MSPDRLAEAAWAAIVAARPETFAAPRG